MGRRPDRGSKDVPSFVLAFMHYCKVGDSAKINIFLGENRFVLPQSTLQSSFLHGCKLRIIRIIVTSFPLILRFQPRFLITIPLSSRNPSACSSEEARAGSSLSSSEELELLELLEDELSDSMAVALSGSSSELDPDSSIFLSYWSAVYWHWRRSSLFANFFLFALSFLAFSLRRS